MTNNDELALKLKAAAEKALPAIEKYEAGDIDGDDALEMLSDFTDVIKPANILALLAERDADKKRIAELEARTVSVKLPKKESKESIAYGGSGAFKMGRASGFNEAIDIMSERLAAAGIKLEVGE